MGRSATGRPVTRPGRRGRRPDPDRVIDLDFVIRKGEQRIAKGPSYTPSMAEIDLIVTALGYLEPLEQDELAMLQDAARRPADEAVSDDGEGQDGCHRPGDGPREGVGPAGVMLAAKMA